MKKIAPLVIIVCALAVILFTLYGADSYSHYTGMRQSLEAQKKINADLHQNVSALKREVNAIQSTKRGLEKAARNELGMARPDEYIFIFDDTTGKAQPLPMSR